MKAKKTNTNSPLLYIDVIYSLADMFTFLMNEIRLKHAHSRAVWQTGSGKWQYKIFTQLVRFVY